jgi:hypothetical protein
MVCYSVQTTAFTAAPQRLQTQACVTRHFESRQRSVTSPAILTGFLWFLQVSPGKYLNQAMATFF